MAQDARSFIQSIPPLVVPPPVDNSSPPVSHVEVDGDNRSEVITIDHQLSQNFNNAQAFELFDNVLFPGAVVQGRIVTEGVMAPISFSRIPGTVVLLDVTVGGTNAMVSKVLQTPDLVSFQQALQELTTQQMIVGTAARTSFFIEQVFSSEHAMLKVGATAKWLTGSAKSTLDSVVDANRTNFVVNYEQLYFDMAFQTPVPPGAFFADSVTSDDLRPFMQEGNPPFYVSKVSYGRKIIFIASSSERTDSFKATLEAAFGFFSVSAGVQLDDEQTRILRDSTIRALVFGGPARSAIDLMDVPDKKAKLSDILREGANFAPTSPGVPMIFELSYARDSAIAQISFAANFRETIRNPIPFLFTAIQLRFEVDDDDKDSDLTASVEVLRNGQLVAFGAFGHGQTWDDHTLQPPAGAQPFILPLNPAVPEADLRGMSLRVSINNSGNGWNTRYDLLTVRDDGLVQRVGSHPKPKHHLGDGDATTFEDPFTM